MATKYYFSWFTDIPTLSGDYIYIGMPPELSMVPTGGDTLTCAGANGLGKVVCKKVGNMLKVTLIEVLQETGLYKITAESIRNAPSLRRSGSFPAMYHAAKPPGSNDEARVAEYAGESYDGKTYVTNEFAADL